MGGIGESVSAVFLGAKNGEKKYKSSIMPANQKKCLKTVNWFTRCSIEYLERSHGSLRD